MTPRPDWPRRHPALRLPDLTPRRRLWLLVVGWLLILLGIVGIFLPILQGFLFLALGAATLSLVSESMLWGLRWLMRPCPRAWRATLRLRRRMLRQVGESEEGKETEGGGRPEDPNV